MNKGTHVPELKGCFSPFRVQHFIQNCTGSSLSCVSAMKQDTTFSLELVQEVKIGDLLRDTEKRRYEASGVFLRDGALHVIFDDNCCLLRARPDWLTDGDAPSMLDLIGTATGYEDLTYHPSARRWYCLIEGTERKKDLIMPRIDVFDDTFAYIKSDWLDFPLSGGNKGFEGVAILERGGKEYLLGLCEGNGCRSGESGATPGKGRIQVFYMEKEGWEHAGTIKLPKTVQFGDYTGLDVRNGTLSVISQVSSAVWFGRIHDDPDGWDTLFENDGQILLFPRDEKGRKMYCNLEGISWLGEDMIVTVSDKAKDEQPGRCSRKDQSIHIFRVMSDGSSLK